METRAAEEKLMLHQEMRSVTDHLHQQHAFLFSAINDTKQPGAKLLKQLERKLRATVMFHQHVPDIVPATHGYITPDNPCLPQASIDTGI